MKKFAANYLVTDSGNFLKNGIVVATETGEIAEFIDTGGELSEIAQLIFLNGILIPNFRFVRVHAVSSENAASSYSESLLYQLFDGQNEVSLQEVIETGKHIQEQFPKHTIPQILEEISGLMLSDGKFTRKQLSGLFLLNGVKLTELKFTLRSKLKKIL